MPYVVLRKDAPCERPCHLDTDNIFLADCGKTVSDKAIAASDKCSTPCNGNNAELCGGPGHVNVYSYGIHNPPNTATIK